MLSLSLSFFLIAWLYASVGFGGGSSYLAFLTFAHIPFTQIPSLSLLCNIIVTSSGCIHFYRQGHFLWRSFWPLLLGSVPMAFLGGLIPISKTFFSLLLGISLVAASLRLLIRYRTIQRSNRPKRMNLICIGASIGFFSGLVGIGGGIFLSPILLNFGWFKPKQVAAFSSAFILLNSLSGFFGQMTKTGAVNLLEFWPLFLAVFCGGQCGSLLSSRKFLSQNAVRILSSILTLYAGCRLLYLSF